MFRHIVCLLLVSLGTATLSSAAELELRKGDHVLLVGNELGERMQHHDFFEALLHQRFPEHELVVRNICHPGDEPVDRLRSLNFGDPHQHLAHSKASVILFLFGFNESFQGKHGIAKFHDDLVALAKDTATRNYSGDGPPRVVFVSPIAFENTGDPHLPDGAAHNANLAMYTEAMRNAATEAGVGFVDLFTPTKQLFERSDERLTLNAVHLNAAGYEALAPILDEGLFGATDRAPGYPQPLMAAIADKNFHWWHRYRAVNGYSIWGTRGKAGSDGTYDNTAVMERERAILDQMTANRDARIWGIVKGEQIAAEVDDSNTLPFIEPKTNVGGEKDPNARAGKLGSLEYRPAREQEKLFTLAPGYEINLFASEEDFPELANPVAMNFDAKGRMWVTTMPSYPQWKPKTVLDDKLLILEDDDADGRADEVKVFAGGLHQPTGFELGDGGVFVANQQDILFLKDADGDDRADVRIRRLVGFDTADSHHGLAAFEWGPGGGLYFQEGTFKQSQIETPYGPQRLSDAGTWRYQPENERFDVHVSLAFANPWGHVFDKWGQNFIADASPGLNYWAAPISGDVSFPDKHPGGSRANGLDWGGSKSKAQYPPFLVKRTRPSSGCEIVSSRHFPDDIQGNFLQNNVIGDRAVLNYTMREDGSGFGGEEVPSLVSCDDGNFRPVDLQFGPDGALYIVDWHNALIGHLQHNLRDPSRDHSHGRIWRVTYKGRALVDPPKIAGATIPELLELLKLPEDRTRYRVRRELAERNEREVIPAVRTWMAGLDPADDDHEHLLLEALWQFQTQDVVDEPLLTRLLNGSEPRARGASVRVASYWLDRLTSPLELLRARIHDEHPRVRLEAVRACSFVHTPESFEVALGALEHPTDVWLDYTITETLRTLEDEVNAKRALMAHADHSAHDHHDPAEHAGHQHGPAVAPPILFLDKPKPVVAFQIDRLTNGQLMAVATSPEKQEFEPVYAAILTRNGLSTKDRTDALAGLTAIRKSEPTAELLDAIAAVPARGRAAQTVAGQLANILLGRPTTELAAQQPRFRELATNGNGFVRAAAMAALVASDDAKSAWNLAAPSPEGRVAYLDGLRLVPGDGARTQLRPSVVELLEGQQPPQVKRAAIATLGKIPAEYEETFQLVSKYVGDDRYLAAATRTLSAVPAENRPGAASRNVVETLVKHAESTPAARRTTPEFLDAMQLADNLLGRLPAAEAKAFRARLREVVVRVVRIDTVEEEMRYDQPFFVVEAGRPVQLVLRNVDLMPHNLVITRPGAMKEVAELAQEMPPTIDKDGMQYVPKSDLVLQPMPMVAPHQQAVVTFTAPKEPGEYPYVCTFPRHWMRMYGVMLVVPDLDAYLANPTQPADPLGQNRDFVRAWTLDELAPEIESGLRGRSLEIGERIFKEASCLQCHLVKGVGGKVGPDLTDVMTRRKGDKRIVLREILDPSHEVDPKFTLYNVITDKGLVLSGIVTAQDRGTITLVTNPEKPEPRTIDRDEIEEMIKTSASIMPKGLLNRFTKDEIFELLAYVTQERPADGAAPTPPGR